MTDEQAERTAGRLLRVEAIEIAWTLVETVDGQIGPRSDVDLMDVFDRLHRAAMRHTTATKRRQRSVSR